MIYTVFYSLQWVFICLPIIFSYWFSLYNCSLFQMQVWSFHSVSWFPWNKIKPLQHSSLISSCTFLLPYLSAKSNSISFPSYHTILCLCVFMWFPLPGTLFPASRPRFTGKNTLPRLSSSVTSFITPVLPLPWCQWEVLLVTSHQVEVTSFYPVWSGQVFFIAATTFYYISLYSCLSLFLDWELLQEKQPD